jgi:hypothetical protein
MEMSGQIYAPAVLRLRKKPLVTILYEVRWVGAGLDIMDERKSLSYTRNRSRAP